MRQTVHRLERTIDMRKQGAMSNTIALSGTVDLESNTKGQVSDAAGLLLLCFFFRWRWINANEVFFDYHWW